MRIWIFLLWCLPVYAMATTPTQGVFYSWDGKYLGQIGKATWFQAAEPEAFKKLQKGQVAPFETIGLATDVFTISAVVFAETFPYADPRERAGIAWAVVNNHGLRQSDARSTKMSLTQTAIKIAHVDNNGNKRYNEFVTAWPFIDDSDMQVSLMITMQVLTRRLPDYSNNAVFWEGENHLRLQRLLTMSKFSRGFEMLAEHQPTPAIPTKMWLEFGPDGWWVLYRFQSTAYWGKTIFCRVHPRFTKVFHAPGF
jgi:hypothetical protein